jgi:hypothetical protein
MAGKFSCDACGKSYTWKPELAGKRVKCKCGQPMSIPSADPADEGGEFGDLAALADGAPTTPGAVAGGPTCPGCGSGVDPAAVICVNCGQNLKTGKKLKTSTAKTGGGAADKFAPGYRSYGAVNNEEGMSDKQKKLVVFSSLGGLALIGVIIVAVVLPARARAKARERQIDARPAKLEHALTAMDENGGFVGAVKSGALAGGGLAGGAPVGGPVVAPSSQRPPGFEFDQRHNALLASANPVVGKKFLLNPKAIFQANNRQQSEKVVNDLYKMGCTSIVVLGVRADMYTNDPVAAGLVATLPEDKPENKDARAKIFAYYRTIENTIEPMDMEPQTEKGQKYLAVEFRDPRADKPGRPF